MSKAKRPKKQSLAVVSQPATRRTRREFGAVPETAGWRRLREWADANTLRRLATLCGVSAPSASAWYWRDSRPGDEMRAVLAKVLGGKSDDWLTADEQRSRRERMAAAVSQAS